ncbi:MAG: GNAT family N-acetyltransferase [Pikeienuella sp.]
MTPAALGIPMLETDRLRLRGPEARDWPTYSEFFGDAEASRFYGGPLRPEQAWKRLAQDIGHWALRGYGIWIVELQESGQAIGGTGLHWAEGWPRRELTWWLTAEARGHGYALEASRAAIEHAVRRLGWDPVETHMADDNAPARALALRLGGRVIAREPFPDGLWRDVYALPAIQEGTA